MAIAAPAAIPIHLRILLRRFIGGSLEVDGELSDHLPEPEHVLAGVVAAGTGRRKALVRPSPGGGVGDGRDVGGDLRGLSRDGGRAEHDREATIERVHHQDVQRQAEEHGGGHREPGWRPGGERRRPTALGHPLRGEGATELQLVRHGGQDPRPQFGRCARGVT